MMKSNEIRLYVPALTFAVRPSFTLQGTPDMELYNLFPPDLIISRSNKKRSDNDGVGKKHDGVPSLQNRIDSLPAMNIKTVVEDLWGSESV